LVNKSVDSDCDQINLKAKNDEQEKQKKKRTVNFKKRIRHIPQKRENDFLW
jgi:hypothetical protein